MSATYTAYHVHSDLSLLDSATKFQDYIDEAVRQGMTTLGCSEHGNIFQWTAKKRACEKAGLKYLHGCEVYLTEALLIPPDPMDVHNRVLEELAELKDDVVPETFIEQRTAELMADGKHKVRDNYHTVLIAKNKAGVLELNDLVSKAYESDHFYYKSRISFDEFLSISKNVIKTSACLASPLNKLSTSHPMYERLVRHYDYLEIQPHLHPDQISFNQHLAQLSSKYGIPLIAGTDTHSLNQYKAECRTLLQDSKHIEFGGEDEFDLTFRTYDKLVEDFRTQDAIPEKLWMEAIENTNRMADSVEDFEVDANFKYPILYGEQDKAKLDEAIESGLQEKIKSGAVTPEQIQPFREAIKEECEVFEAIGMSSFMLFMSEMIRWCRDNDIPVGFSRGSVGGSRVAYLTDIIDLNPETWNTVFSRFANKDRREIGDIDVDFAPDDREQVYNYIINRFGQEKTAFILAIGTVQDKGVVDEIVRAFSIRWGRTHLHDLKPLNAELKALRSEKGDPEKIKELVDRIATLKKENEEIAKSDPWPLSLGDRIKKEMSADLEAARQKYPEVFYYFDGLRGVSVSQSMHPAGIVASPITLRDNFGTFVSDGKVILQLDMDEVHETGLVKYDILGLKNVQIIKDTCEMAGIPYPQSHEINWDDQEVWADMLRSPVGIFEFEGAYAHEMLRKYVPHSVFDLSLVTAAIRPSGASYRTELMNHKPNHNPSKLIDDLLVNSNGYLCIAGDQMIDTEDGLKQMKDISVGDMVLTRNGYRQVTDARQTGHKEVLEISYLGMSLKATADHRILTETGYRPCGELSPGDVIGIRVGGVCGRSHDVDSARIIGRSIDDGNLRNNCVSATNSVGLMDKKSADKFVPDFILNGDLETILAFLGAYTDTDSCIKNGQRVVAVYHTISEKLAYQLQYLIRKLGFVSSVCRDRYAFQVVVNEPHKYLRTLYNDSIKIQRMYSRDELVASRPSHSNSIHLSLAKQIFTGQRWKQIVKATGLNLYSKNMYVSLETVRRAAVWCGITLPDILTNENIRWVRITDIKLSKATDVYDMTVECDHEFVCQGVITHNCYQEDIIKFLQQVCGFSGSDADNTRRAIARKDEARMQEALPKILEGYCAMSDQPRDVAEEEAKEFLRVIEDASSYMFGLNHSIGYSMLGYLCAYLRYYHPYEFITAYLNNANNDEDIRMGTELAAVYNIRITPPKFGSSKDKYMFDKEDKLISKGVSSVKFLNRQVSNALYKLSQNGKPDTFMDLLMELKGTGIDVRQREILVKLDYFSHYGNAKELLRMVELFSYLKNGEAKSIHKSKVEGSALEPFLRRHATDTNMKGKVLKSYTITDMPGLLSELEDYVRSFNLTDFGFRDKIRFQDEYLGYVDLTTGKSADRRRLYVSDVFPLKGKNGEPWGYALTTKSIGSGKVSRMTVRARLFERLPIRKGNVIYAHDVGKERDYWYLYRYDISE